MDLVAYLEKTVSPGEYFLSHKTICVVIHLVHFLSMAMHCISSCTIYSFTIRLSLSALISMQQHTHVTKYSTT